MDRWRDDQWGTSYPSNPHGPNESAALLARLAGGPSSQDLSHTEPLPSSDCHGAQVELEALAFWAKLYQTAKAGLQNSLQRMFSTGSLQPGSLPSLPPAAAASTYAGGDGADVDAQVQAQTQEQERLLQVLEGLHQQGLGPQAVAELLRSLYPIRQRQRSRGRQQAHQQPTPREERAEAEAAAEYVVGGYLQPQQQPQPQRQRQQPPLQQHEQQAAGLQRGLEQLRLLQLVANTVVRTTCPSAGAGAAAQAPPVHPRSITADAALGSMAYQRDACGGQRQQGFFVERSIDSMHSHHAAPEPHSSWNQQQRSNEGVPGYVQPHWGWQRPTPQGFPAQRSLDSLFRGYAQPRQQQPQQQPLPAYQDPAGVDQAPAPQQPPQQRPPADALAVPRDHCTGSTPRDPGPPDGPAELEAQAAKRARREEEVCKVCANCRTTDSPFWRKDRASGLPLCNACGLYLAKYDHPRPTKLWGPNAPGRNPRLGPGQAPEQPPAPLASAQQYLEAALRNATAAAAATAAATAAAGQQQR